jgi:EAL domain-containing protein (putative c-di-GMP-specific phosphodiesterase class I)
MGEAQLERLELIDALRSSVTAADIEVVYQPVVRVDTGRIVGVEALARWNRDGIPVPPDVFISVAEETGMIVPLGEAVMRLVALAAPTLLAAAHGHPLSVNVNISAAQLRDPGFITTVARASTALRGMSLVLEITERQGVELDDEILAAMHTMEAMGVAFAIDDFGVGFSSISYLRNLPAQILKVDASLTADIDHDARARALLGSVILMAHSMNFEAVIEGVEREGQLAVLREDAPSVRAQGFLMHRPMPLESLSEALASERSVPAQRGDLR